MGLSICRSIIEAHRGQMSARSRTPEPGAVFQCILPIGGLSA
jgi:signal transduction histidine kinase